MFKNKPLALILSLAALGLSASSASAATSPDGAWTASGTGTTTATSDGTTASDPVLNYSVAGNSGSWQFTATAKTAHQQQVIWHYNGYHAWFGVRVGIVMFVKRGGQEIVNRSLAAAGPVNCCAAPSGGFDYKGSATFDLQPGDVYGFRMSGSNADSDRRLLGTLTLTFVPPAASDAAFARYKELMGSTSTLSTQIQARQSQISQDNVQLQQLNELRNALLAAGHPADAAVVDAQIKVRNSLTDSDKLALQSLVNMYNDEMTQMSNLLPMLTDAQKAAVGNPR